LATEQGEESTDALVREIRREQRAFRERVLKGVTLSLLVACGGVLVSYLFFRDALQVMWPVLTGAMAGLGCVLAATRGPFALRSTVTLASLYAPCCIAVVHIGVAPNAFVGFGMVCVAGTLFLGRRAGIALVAVCAATIGAIGLAHHAGLISRDPNWRRHLDIQEPATAVRVLVIFVLVTTTLVLAVSYLLSHSEELLLQRARSLSELRREQRERERVTRDLEHHESAFQKARELELLGRLAGSMAHDFNNALLVIWVALDELRDAELPASAEPALAALRSAADQAYATTKQLRAFGPAPPNKLAPVTLGPLVEKARAMFARVLPENITFLAEVKSDASILADEGEVLRVLMNLALNGRDAMREGGTLTLRVRPLDAHETPLHGAGGGTVVVEVVDTGAGMSDEVKTRLFEPFFTTKDGAGTGLGLASVQAILTAQGGCVEVTSALGTGTTIALYFPTVTPKLTSVLPGQGAFSDEPLTVLLVDDNAAVRRSLRRGLERANMTVLDAADGAAALELVRRHRAPIHVLCTDYVMPGPPLASFVAEFRERHGGRVLVCSGYAPADGLFGAGIFDDFLPKPFASETLAMRIRALARNPVPSARG
jgi:signal transduction histidine kinase